MNKVDQLRRRYRAKLDVELKQLREELVCVRRGADPEAALRESYRLAGTAGMFGFPRCGELFAELERALRGWTSTPNDRGWITIERILSRLEKNIVAEGN